MDCHDLPRGATAAHCHRLASAPRRAYCPEINPIFREVMSKVIIPALLGCVLVCATHGQHVRPPPIQWQQTSGGDSLDYGVAAVLQTADDGFVIGATSLSGISGNKTSPSFDRADGSFAGDFW